MTRDLDGIFCNPGKSKPDSARAVTCCMVLVRLLGSKPCFDAIKTLPEIATILFQVFLSLLLTLFYHHYSYHYYYLHFLLIEIIEIIFIIIIVFLPFTIRQLITCFLATYPFIPVRSIKAQNHCLPRNIGDTFSYQSCCSTRSN